MTKRQTLLAAVREHQQFSDSRMPSLYSDFRKLKESNWDGYESNIRAWKGALIDALVDGYFEDIVMIKADGTLLERLSDPKFGKPLAVDAVFDELVADKTLMPLSVFKAQTKSILSSRWFDVRSIAAWAITKSGLWDTTWKAATAARNKLVLRNEKYIDLQALDKMASEVLQHLKEQATSYTTSVFEKDSAVVSIRKEWPRLSTDDVSVILTYLSRDKAMLAVDDIYVKIYGPRVAGPISEKDRAVVNLKTVIGQVSVRVDRLSLRIGEDTSRAKDAIKRNNNALAKYALRSKKSVEASQTKSLEMLENLEMVLTKIDEASDQLEIVNALQSGATILASLNAEVGGAERLSELMDNVRDHVDETDEIGREIASLTADHIDDDEVDEELEALTKDKTTTKERAEDLFAALPAPPTQQPKVPDEPTVEDLSNELEAMQV